MEGAMKELAGKRKAFWIFWAAMFLGAFFALSQSGYSDGDDAFFYQYTHSMGFFEYLGWRYENWVGRMAGEALVYVAFRLGLMFWRIMDALMLVLLPIGILRLAGKAARIPEGTVKSWCEKSPAFVGYDYHTAGLPAAVAAVAGYFLMSAATIGYAAVWVNGSIFYTWTFTCGIWALQPFADCVFTGKTNPKNFIYAIPCAVAASMSIEQMGAVLLVFEILGVLCIFYRTRRIHALLLVQTLVTLLAFGILFAAPGNDIRVAAEIVNWLPEYDTMSAGQHIFITVQWLLSSFANENKLFLCGIWIAGILLLMQRKNCAPGDYILTAAAAVFTAASLLPYVGITVLSDLGMGRLLIEARIDQAPSAAGLSAAQAAAMAWWAAALVFTFIYIWKVSGFQAALLLAYLAGIASEAIMFFSPTIYASGARVYYLTDLLYLFIILCLSFGLRERKHRNWFYAGLAGMGAVNFVYQIPVFIGQMGR